MDDEPSMRVAFSADSTRLYSVTLDRLRAWELRTDTATGRLRAERLELPGRGDRHFRDSTTAEIFDGGERWLSISREPRSRRPSWVQGRFDSVEIESRGGVRSRRQRAAREPGRPLAGLGQLARAGRRRSRASARTIRPSCCRSPARRRLRSVRTAACSRSAERRRSVSTTSARCASSIRSSAVRSGRCPLNSRSCTGRALCAVALPPDEVLIVDTTTGAELATLPASSFILWA